MIIKLLFISSLMILFSGCSIWNTTTHLTGKTYNFVKDTIE